MVEDFLKNEMHHYIELRHGRKLLDLLLTLEQAVANQNYIRIRYQKMKNREIVERKVKPVGIMFSEFYFYMTAYIEGMEQEKVSRNPADQTPTIYRLDRMRRSGYCRNISLSPMRNGSRKGNSASGSVHVRRQAAEGEVPLLRQRPGFHPGQDPYREDHFPG